MKAQARLRASAAPTATARADRGARAVPLPHRGIIVSRYGGRAAHIPVVVGPAVAESLRRRGAKGASLDGVVFLPNEQVGPDLVAHEVAHALQQLQGGAPALANDLPTLIDRLAHVPVLPESAPAEVEAQAGENTAQVAHDPVHGTLPPGVVSLRRLADTPVHDAAPQPAPAPESPTPATPAPPTAQAAPTPEAAAPEAAQGDIAPTFTPPEFVEPTLDPEVAAQREAAAAAAREALAAADSPEAVMAAYGTMAPSQQAAVQPELGARLGDAATASNAKLGEATPVIEVESRGGDGPLPMPRPVAVPADAPDIELDAAADPTVLVPEGPVQPQLRVDPAYGPAIERRFTESSTAERVEESLDAVSTANPGIETRVADRAAVPLDGANDPQRLDDAVGAQREQASAVRQEAAQAVMDGPGPEQVVPRALNASAPAPAFPGPQTEGLQPAPEAAQLQAMALPDSVVASFDTASAAQMQASAETSRQEMARAQDTRDTAHQQAVDTAETDRQAAEQEADGSQRQAVADERQAIQDKRQETVDEQNRQMAEVNGQASRARRDKRAEAQREVDAGQRRIDDRYDEAERDAEAEIRKGEEDAERERQRKKRESEEASWWERAVNFIRDAFDALVSLVNRIFDAVRSAITGLIDLARRAVVGLIEAISQALQALVSALGELLKGLVDGLLGEIFPELARALNEAIDSAVNRVNSAIDSVAQSLVSAVNAIAAALTSAVNALLDVFQGAINAALAVLEAALTGDWGALLIKVLDAVLSVLGIDPAAFHAMIAQASEAVSTIVNDPGQFVSNMIDVVVGGVQLFADHFGEHLRRGIIGWLTGALGDIQIPNEWNLWTVLDLARQILGLTWDFVRERAARIIGPENVERLEMMASWIGTLITEGWSGLWNRIQESLASLRDSVLASIREFVMERVIMAAITWLASLFNPVGALVKLVMTIWNIYQFVSSQLQRLFGIVQTVVGAIANIAAGVLEPGKLAVEAVLGNLVPVVIDLLMSLLGVTGVAARVREIIQQLRQRIADAVDAMLQRILQTLGLRRGRGPAAEERAAVEAAAAAGGAPGQIGHPVRVDVAEGEDHTLSIDRTGAGGATVMLRSDPRPLGQWLDTLAGMAASEPNATKKATAETKIGEARTLLNQLDPIADQAAAATASAAATAPGPAHPAPAAPAAATAVVDRATSIEERLGPVLKQIFDNIGGGTDAFIERYRAQIDALHPDARNGINRELRRDVGLYAASPDWAGVETRLKSTYALFAQPYLAQSAAFPTAAREAATQALTGHKTGLERRPAEDPNGQRRAATPEAVLRLLAENVTATAPGAYGALHAATAELILRPNGRTFRNIMPELIAAVAQATTSLATSAGERDPALVAAVSAAGGIIPFMNAMALTRRSGTMTESALEAAWGNQANVDYMKDLFRDVMPAMHEWIPSNYIPNILRIASATGATAEEAGETVSLWVTAQNRWRTPTRMLIFKPEGPYRRAFPANVPQPDGTVVHRNVVVLQGHSGALYARAEEDALSTRSVGQTKGQPGWHNALRNFFEANANAGTSDSRASIRTIIGAVEGFVEETILQSAIGGDVANFTTYQDASGDDETLAQVLSRATASFGRLQNDFRDIRGVVG
ncbi:MAG: hypothetical protein J7500_00980 [Sphingomonas sp.]|uniref:eCIS core domain-containing protein n=1 Tax=Sphingomonas sp. TaxID=28214 RepID=UPI001B2DD7BA|nr:hypothetical protein [Sphingomonas sp.]MBO9621261.1 hypothetical protein [Sphingomonas sp.]